MNNFVLHIEYLLQSNNCVIVPSLGGFVVNKVQASRVGLSKYTTPSYELVFNQQLSHNDGLLAELYMRLYDISFDVACEMIEKQVKELRRRLQNESDVLFGSLGLFNINRDDNFVFTPKAFDRADTYGLRDTSLKPLIQLSVTSPKKYHNSEIGSSENGNYYLLGRVAAVAAVIVLIFLSFPFSLNNIDSRQHANIMFNQNIFDSPQTAFPENDNSADSAQSFSEAYDEIVAEDYSEVVASNSVSSIDDTVEVVSESKFYVIVGVYEVRDVADKQLQSFKEKGYKGANFLRKDEARIFLYTDAFPTREKAHSHLNLLSSRDGIDAWILEHK